jgi:inhibitor-of-growth protein 2
VRRAFSKVRELANLEKKYEESLESTQKLVISLKAVESTAEKDRFIL